MRHDHSYFFPFVAAVLCLAACSTEDTIANPGLNATGVDAVGSDAPDGAAIDLSDVPTGIDLGKKCRNPQDCDDKNPCTTDPCAYNFHQFCQHLPLENGTLCDDNNACTIVDKCEQGICKPGTPKVCDDKNVCTKDVCQADGGCAFPALQEGKDCDDGDPCTDKDTCNAGAKCKGLTGTCNDGNICTDDSCDKVKGCQNLKVLEGPCDDSDVCTVEKCDLGLCVKKPVNCEDSNPCTADACDPASGCYSTDVPEGGLCDDKKPCTVADTCVGGACKSTQLKNCDDFNLCTSDSCDQASGECLHKPSGLTKCNDNNECTQNDSCVIVSGKAECAGSSLDCEDGNPCTSDTCDGKTGCIHKPNNGACNDNNPCTTGDYCDQTTCKGGVKQQCDDNNLCTEDTCTVSQGCKFTSTDTIPCNDDNACTKDDKCKGSNCIGTALNCDDNNPCTSDGCSQKTGCSFTKVSNGASCDDGNPCTVKETCQDGKCIGGTSTVCNDGNACTADVCDQKTGKCAFTPLFNDTPCEDGNKCTKGDFCLNGSCVGQLMQLCTDGKDCTLDKCDPTSGSCVFTPIPGCKQ